MFHLLLSVVLREDVDNTQEVDMLGIDAHHASIMSLVEEIVFKRFAAALQLPIVERLKRGFVT
jgi:hypothetical protein